MCIFCKIIKGEIPSNKVYENDEFLAFHDINPKAPIHILVIPKEHVEKFQDTTPKMMAKMTLFIQELAKKLELDTRGYRLVVNNGKDGGQEVMHLHFHILGGIKLIWPELTPDESKKYI